MTLLDQSGVPGLAIPGSALFGGDEFSAPDLPSGTLTLFGSVLDHWSPPVTGGGRAGKVSAKGKKYLPPLNYWSDPAGRVTFTGRVEESYSVLDKWVVEEDEVELLLALA